MHLFVNTQWELSALSMSLTCSVTPNWWRQQWLPTDLSVQAPGSSMKPKWCKAPLFRLTHKHPGINGTKPQSKIKSNTIQPSVYKQGTQHSCFQLKVRHRSHKSTTIQNIKIIELVAKNIQTEYVSHTGPQRHDTDSGWRLGVSEEGKGWNGSGGGGFVRPRHAFSLTWLWD